MITTQDGHILSIGDQCWMVILDDNNEYIDSFTKCVYRGSLVVEHELAPPPLPIGCSGSIFLPKQTKYCFDHISGTNINFKLLEYDVNNTIIKDLSNVVEVIKRKLK